MKPIKVVAVVLASLVGLLVLALAALVLWFDPNDYKSYLTDWVEQRTGRPLTVSGDLELKFFPWLAIETGDVTLGNSESFVNDEPFATADRAAAEVKLIPLLRKRVEIGTVRLEGLRLNLARDATGRGNWEDLADPGAADGADEVDDTAPSGDAAPAWMESLDAEGVRIRDALVHWSEQGELRYVASGIMLETGAIARGEPVDVSLAVDVLDVASQRTFAVEAKSDVLLGDRSGDGFAVELRDFGFGLRLADGQQQALGEGRLDAALVRGAADGRIEIGAARAAARLPGVSSAPGGLSLGAQWRLAVLDPVMGSLQIDELATDVAGIEAQWQLEGRNLIDSPEIEGSVIVASQSITDALETFEAALPTGLDPAALGMLDATAAFRVALAPPTGGPDVAGAGASAALDVGPYRLKSMSLSAVDASALGVALRGEALIDGSSLQARVDIPEFTASDALLAIARPYTPDAIEVEALERVSFSSGVAADLGTGRITLSDTRAALLGAELRGNVEIDPASGGKAYRGTIETTRFEPDRLVLFLGDLLSEGLSPNEIGTLAFDGRFDYDARSDRLALDQLTIEAFGLAATGTATLSDLGSAPVSTGQARVALFSPRELMRRFDQPVPDTSDDAALQRASIDAAFAVDTENGRFTDIALVLDDSRITGDFSVSNFQDPDYSFTLAIDEVNADRYLPPRAVDAPADAPEGAPTAGDIELPMDALENLNMNGRVSVGDLRLAGLDFQEVATNITIGGGAGSLDSASARLYGGEFAGSFKVAAVDGQPGLTLTGRASSLTLEPMIVALTGDANFSGTGDFDLNLSGRGATVIENVRSANGNVGFALEAGAIQGFNLGRTLCSVYNSTQKLPAPAEQEKATAYEVISGTASVTEGVASSPDLLARTSFMDVTGRGSLGLAEQRLDYDLDAKLTGSIGIRGCESMDALIGDSIPFTLRGTVTDPEIRPDFSKIVQRRIQEEIKDRIGDRLQDRLRDLLE